MSKKLIIFLMVMLFLLTACTNGANSKDSNNSEAQKSSIPLFKNTVVELADSSFELLDYYLIKSEGDVIKDMFNIYQRISDTMVDSTKFGFDIGYNNSKPEVSTRDTYLLLILNYNPNNYITSQRDSIIPKMDISAVDNKGDSLLLLHNSMDNKYIQVENPKGVLIFKTFADSETVDFTFDDNEYKFIIDNK